MEQAAPAPAQQTTRPSSILYRSLKTMAHIVPLIQEIMPMVMTGTISVTKSAEVLPPPPASQALDESGERTVPGVRVISRNAVVDKSDKLSARVLIVKPNSSTFIHHHGEQDSIIYVSSGKGVLLAPPKDDDAEEKPKRHTIEKGDFAYVPAWTENQILNESYDSELHLVFVQSGGAPVDVDLESWSGPRA